jgi:hypothetical protein
MKKTREAKARNVIGKRVRKARLACKPPVTQDDLVGRLARHGIALDQTGISRIENETRYVMDYEAVAIARALRVSVAWLFGEES